MMAPNTLSAPKIPPNVARRGYVSLLSCASDGVGCDVGLTEADKLGGVVNGFSVEGACVLFVGCPVGNDVFSCEGACVGEASGRRVGIHVGVTLGVCEGARDGF